MAKNSVACPSYQKFLGTVLASIFCPRMGLENHGGVRVSQTTDKQPLRKTKSQATQENFKFKGNSKVRQKSGLTDYLETSSEKEETEEDDSQRTHLDPGAT